MSSLLQHRGRTSRKKGVELFFYLVDKAKNWEEYNGPNAYRPSPNSTTFTTDREKVILRHPSGEDRAVPKLYRAWRKPVGMWGCWVVFRYLGDEHVPDLSIPIAVFDLPRGAEPLSDEEIAEYWWGK